MDPDLVIGQGSNLEQHSLYSSNENPLANQQVLYLAESTAEPIATAKVIVTQDGFEKQPHEFNTLDAN